MTADHAGRALADRVGEIGCSIQTGLQWSHEPHPFKILNKGLYASSVICPQCGKKAVVKNLYVRPGSNLVAVSPHITSRRPR